MIETPWYKWFPAAWLSSETRLTMSILERAVYRDLLDCCYEKGSIPSDPALLAKLADVTPDQFAEAWPKVSQKFIPCADGRLSNPVVLETLAKRGAVSDSRASSGHHGGIRSGETRRSKREANASGERSKREANASILLPAETKQVASLRAREEAEAEAEAEVEVDTPLPPTRKSRQPEWIAREFQRLVHEYPNASGVDTSCQLWIGYVMDGIITDPADVFAGLQRWKESAQWVRDNGQYVPALDRWLSEKRWRDHPTPAEQRRKPKPSSRGADPDAPWIPPWEDPEVAA